MARLLGRVLARHIAWVSRSSTRASDPADPLAALAAHHPCIVAIWHGQQALAPVFKPPGIPVKAMVARHSDAEIIAEALRHFDVELIRGAGAGARRKDRGGAAALRAGLKALKGGASVVMTAEVPPGPFREVGLGIVTFAKLSGRPIVPIAAATSRYSVLANWSRLAVAWPYGRLGMAVGEPIVVPADADAEDLEAARRALQSALTEISARAFALARADEARALGTQSDLPRTGPVLGSYRGLTRAMSGLAPMILNWRQRRGKEDPARRDERLGLASLPRPMGPLWWFHAASVGETNVALPLIHRLLDDRPELEILLTTGTRTSATLAASRLPARARHQFVPIDAPRFVRRFLDHWRPEMAFFIESEIWPNMIVEASDRGCRLVLLNARMSKTSQSRWRKLKRSGRALFGRFDLVLTQTQALARFLERMGARSVAAVGNLKIDSPAPPFDVQALSDLHASIGNRPVLLAASTQAGEEELIARAHRLLRDRRADHLAIIVPRHPERGPAIAEALEKDGHAVRLRSRGQLPSSDCDIYIADTLGELGTFYRLTRLAFIGGSLVPHGGQNPIEAIKSGAAVITGPYWFNFPDAYRELIRLGAAKEVASPEALAATIAEITAQPGQIEAMVGRGETALKQLAGALEATLKAIDRIAPLPSQPNR